MTEERKREILEDIKKNGYLQEMEVARILERNHWYSDLNSFYVDPETNVLREVDVLGMDYSNSDGVYFKHAVVIEVKHSKKRPWFFFCTRNNYLRLDYQTNAVLKHYNWFHGKGEFYRDHPRYEIDYRANNYYEPYRNSTDDSMIYKALVNVAKACISVVDGQFGLSMPETAPTFNPSQVTSLMLSTPIVVFDGEMMRGYQGEYGFEIEEVEYVTVRQDVIDKGGDRQSFDIDVININYLETYLKNLSAWAHRASKRISVERVAE